MSTDDVARVQILTIEQLLKGAKPNLLLVDPSAGFEKAATEQSKGQQSSLDL